MEENENDSEVTNRTVTERKNLFSKDYQPPGWKKSLGQFKKNKGRKMLRALLELPFEGGDVDDPDNPGKKIPNPLKKQAAAYFGMPEELITVEMIMAMRQIGLSVQKGDTAAFHGVWEKSYGRPVEDNSSPPPPPVLEIKVITGMDNELPAILEKENEDYEDRNIIS